MADKLSTGLFMPHRNTTRFEQSLRRSVLLAAALALLVGWGAVLALLAARRSEAIEAEVRQNTNLARALEEQTLRVLAVTDQALVRLASAAVTPGTTPDLVRYANETGLVPDILVQLSLVGSNGRFIGSNLDPQGLRTGPVDLSRREHVRAHLAPATLPAAERPARADDLFIGKPVLGKVSKKWTIQLSRRAVDAEGRLGGVVVASLDPGYFENVYRRVALGRQGGMTLIGADLDIRARVIGGTSAGLGTVLAADGPFARRGNAAEGRYIARSTVDGIERIVAYRQVAHYPLYLLVSTSMDEALADWRNTRNTTLTLTALLSLALLAGAAGFVHSLKRMARANQALRRSEAEAQAANQAKSEFLTAVSHELRTPLTSIRGFAELMEHRLDSPKFREQAALIRKGAEHLNTLLTEILDLSKVEAGAMPLNVSAVDLRPLVQGTADFFALTASDKGLALAVQVADGVPATLPCDGLRLKQILNNLLSNAIKFTATGSVTVVLEREADWLAFHVSDTGPGIAPELQEVVFERFRQADARVSFQHGGTGLGLALSRGLAVLMRGSLTLISSPGDGARFTLRLPLAPSAG